MIQETRLKGIITYEDKEYAFYLESNRLEILPGNREQIEYFKHSLFNSLNIKQTNKIEIIPRVKLKGYLSTTESIEIELGDNPSNDMGYLSFPVYSYLKKSSNHSLSEVVRVRLESNLLQHCMNPLIFQKSVLNVENKQSKSIEYKFDEDLRVSLGNLSFNGGKISIYCNGLSTTYSNSLTPYIIRLIVDYDLEKPLQFDELNDLVLYINNSFKFIFRNNNLIFNSFELFRNDKKFGIINLGNFNILKKNISDNDQIKAIALTDLKDSYANLLSEIINHNFTLNHIPFISPNHYTVSREIEIFSAFESEFKINYEDINFNRSEEYIFVKNECLEFMKSLKEGCTGKKKKKCNEIIKGINNSGHSLGQMYSHAINENSEIIKQVFRQYKDDYNTENVDNITDRINDIRNALAHGHLDFEEKPDDVFCFKLVEILIYTMQLKRMQVHEENIKKIIAELFKITF